MPTLRLLCWILLCLPVCKSGAALSLPPLFRDGMVLQREKRVPVWGEATPGESVHVEFAGQQVTAIAGEDGHWQAHFEPMAASGESRTLKIRNATSGETRIVNDVLVGEVWLCSGQSNMFMPMGGIEWAKEGVADREAEIAQAQFPELRLYSDPANSAWNDRGWQRCSPETVRAFSATAYYFGRKLCRSLNVPIGLIHLSRGGSPIQQWMPPAWAQQVPWIQKHETLFNQNRQRIQDYNTALLKYHASRQQKAAEEAVLPPEPEPLPEDLDTARSYYGHQLFEQLITPVIPFAIRGVIWYQGESNSRHRQEAVHYDAMLRGLIRGWRAQWGEPALPFYFVQLPGWDQPEARDWPWTRQSMLTVECHGASGWDGRDDRCGRCNGSASAAQTARRGAPRAVRVGWHLSAAGRQFRPHAAVNRTGRQSPAP